LDHSLDRVLVHSGLPGVGKRGVEVGADVGGRGGLVEGVAGAALVGEQSASVVQIGVLLRIATGRDRGRRHRAERDEDGLAAASGQGGGIL
jgi:hypothetical protein